MSSQKQRDLRKIARNLIKDPETPKQKRTDPPPTWAAFRPITGHRTDQPLPPIDPVKWRNRRRPGQRRVQKEPMELFLMNMTRREKRQWQRACRDLGLPMAVVVRLALRFFLSSNKMQRIIQSGPRQWEYQQRVRKSTMWQRIEHTLTDKEKYEINYAQHINELNAGQTPEETEPCPNDSAPKTTSPTTPTAKPTPTTGTKPRLMIVTKKDSGT